MPDDSNGIYNVPVGTLVNTGDTVLPSQHNPWANDSATAISNRFSKDGRAPATGNWNLNTFRITNLGAPTANADAATKAYVDGLAFYTPQTLDASQQAAARKNISAPLFGHIYGLSISNNVVDVANDIDIAVGECASTEATPVLMQLSSPITKQLDNPWAVGSGNGGLDTGSIANTTYHVWIIQRSDTGVVDVLFSASATSPTMPANYDRKRRIGSIIRSSGTIIPFYQDVDDFSLVTPVIDYNSSSSGTSAVLIALTVPSGIRVRANINIVLQTMGASADSVYISDTRSADQPPNTSSSPLAQIIAESNSRSATSLRVFSNTSRQIRSRQGTGGATEFLRIATLGWSDNRGR